MNNRRDFIKKSALALAAITAAPAIGKALTTSEFLEKENALVDYEFFTLPALPYAYDALEPHIDKLTMEIHHSKHHQGYVNNLNKALMIADMRTTLKPTIEEILAKVGNGYGETVRNNAGGHYNHSLFWQMMSPPGKIGFMNEPQATLAVAIKATFGSFDEFKKQFAEAGTKVFGSGWVWLVKTKEGKLVITSTPNQDNPLMNLESIEVKGAPILALDVWEHAYYLKNQNKRADYIASWWNVVNWEMVQAIFDAK